MSNAVVLTCTPSADLQRVWRALTTDEGLAEWFWPMFDDVDYRFQATPGAHYAIRTDSQDMGVHGQVTEADAPHHIAFTWIWDPSAKDPGGGDDQPDHVSIELQPADYQTLVTLTHTLAHPEDEAPITQGWSDCLQRLEKIR